MFSRYQPIHIPATFPMAHHPNAHDPPPIHIPTLPLAHAPIELPPNANIDLILQVHRRKMLRRAANRRSAQLSRARKKAHLEDLKAENLRLQRLVDYLDSQPELVFVTTRTGRITYVSERTMSFVRMRGEDSPNLPDPTHLSQLLDPASVEVLLQCMGQMYMLSSENSREDRELNLLFSAQEVNFTDMSGQEVRGMLRVSKVNKRSPMAEYNNPNTGGGTGASNPRLPSPSADVVNWNAASGNPPSKKAKKSSGSTAGSVTGATAEASEGSNWNLSNFKLLTECATSLEPGTAAEATPSNAETATQTSSSNGGTAGSRKQSTSGDTDSNVPSEEGSVEEDEYVCVIRTPDSFFTAHKAGGGDLRFFAVCPPSPGESGGYGGEGEEEGMFEREGGVMEGMPVMKGNRSSKQRGGISPNESEEGGNGRGNNKGSMTSSETGSNEGSLGGSNEAEDST
eukprot:gene26758-32334_t